MEKMKNFFYDKNDLLIALIVVAAALFIITNRVEAIMAYPEYLAQVQAEQDKETADADQVAPPSNADQFRPGKDTTGAALAAENEDGAAAAKNPNTTGAGTASPSADKPASDGQSAAASPAQKPAAPASSLYIQNGDSWGSVATKLLNAGLIPSKEDFMSAVSASHKENRLQVGNFTIPGGSNSTQIVAIITR